MASVALVRRAQTLSADKASMFAFVEPRLKLSGRCRDR